MTYNDRQFRVLIGPTGESFKVRIILSYTRFTWESENLNKKNIYIREKLFREY